MQDVLKGKHRQGDTQSLLPRYQRLCFFLDNDRKQSHSTTAILVWPFLFTTTATTKLRVSEQKKVSLPHHAPPPQPIGPNPHLHLHLHAPSVPCRKTSHKPEPHPQGDQPPHLTPPTPSHLCLFQRHSPVRSFPPKVDPEPGNPLSWNEPVSQTDALRPRVRLLSVELRASSSPTSQLSDFSHEQAVGRHCLGSASGDSSGTAAVTACFVFPLFNHDCCKAVSTSTNQMSTSIFADGYRCQLPCRIPDIPFKC